MSNTKKRRTYDKEFKREAVRLVIEEGRKAAEVERNLGIGRSTVGRWVREMREDPEQAFPGKGRLKANGEEIRVLKRELQRVKRERDILKKAVAIFSMEPDRYSRS
jgi:transposase